MCIIYWCKVALPLFTAFTKICIAVLNDQDVAIRHTEKGSDSNTTNLAFEMDVETTPVTDAGMMEIEVGQGISVGGLGNIEGASSTASTSAIESHHNVQSTQTTTIRS